MLTFVGQELSGVSTVTNNDKKYSDEIEAQIRIETAAKRIAALQAWANSKDTTFASVETPGEPATTEAKSTRA